MNEFVKYNESRKTSTRAISSMQLKKGKNEETRR